MLKIILFLFVSNVAFGQQYESVFIEKSKIDNNSVYQIGRRFVFECEIIVNDTLQRLTNNSNDQFSLVKLENDSIQNPIIPLSIIKPKPFRRSNKRQTQALYTFKSNNLVFESYTGIIENEINSWIHPPRFGFFKSLETCPFPYIKLHAQEGESWEDQMLIGEHWSNDFWGVWEGNLLLQYEYNFIRKDSIASDLGNIECKVIEATATSGIGSSKLTSYYSPKYGFVKLEYILFNGTKINLNLIAINESE